MSDNEKTGYQTIINGKVRQIETLTREELIAELISCIDTIEELDILHSNMQEYIEKWKAGQ